MFAYVNYLLDGKRVKIPVNLIKRFHPKHKNDYSKDNIYRTFWNERVSKMQDDKHIEALKKFVLPPKKDWVMEKGEKFYDAKILCLAGSLEELNELIESTDLCQMEPISTTDKEDSESDEAAQDAGNKYNNLLKDAARTRILQSLPGKFMTEDDYRRENAEMKKRIAEIIEENISIKKLYAELQSEKEEVNNLNKGLQKQILELMENGKKSNSNSPPSDEELPEDVDLGNGVVIKRRVLEAVNSETTVSRFVKSLAVALWTEDVLAQRSVSGIPCRNVRGCKKKTEEEVNRPAKARLKLTPEKLNIITVRMDEYMMEKNYDINTRAESLKKRNRFIMEKISDIRKKKK